MATARGNFSIPKKYYSRELGRPLSYHEIIVSDLPDYVRTDSFRQARVQLAENSPDEIVSAVKEMNERLDGVYSSQADIATYEKLVRTIEARAHHFRRRWHFKQSNGTARRVWTDWSWANPLLGIEYLKANPDFLAHGCKFIETLQSFSGESACEFVALVQRLIKEGDYDNAAWISSAMVELCRNDSEAWLYRAKALRLADEPAEALEAIERSLQLHESAEAHREAIEIRRMLGRQHHEQQTVKHASL
jgi:hypothetical protein